MSLRLQAQIHQMSNPLRAFRSLREGHVLELSRITAREQGRWKLERHEGYDGDLTVLITSAEPQAGEGCPSLVVHRTQAGFHLAVSRDDDYAKLGCFTSMEELVAKLWEAMSRAGGDAGPGSPSDQTSARSRSSRASSG